MAFLQASVEPLDWLSKLGLGGVAGLIFWYYRSDRMDSQRRHEDCEKRLEAHFQVMQGIVQSNTTAMTQLVDAIEELRK